MSLYSNLRVTARRLLARYGQPVVLRTVTPGAYDASTGQQAVATSDATYNGALFDFEGETERSGELVREGDKLLIIEGAASPTPKDKVVVGGSVYAIVGIPQSVSPAGTAVVHQLHLRK